MSMYYRPTIQNGQVNKRPRTVTYSPQPKRQATLRTYAAVATPAWAGPTLTELKQQGLSALALDEKIQVAMPTTTAAVRARILLLLVVAGAVLAGGFMFSLRDHFTAYAYGREAVKMQFKIDQKTAEQNYLAVQQQRSSNPTEMQRAAQEANLAPVQFDAVRPAAVQTTKGKTAQQATKTNAAAGKKSGAAEHH